jgi:hypothetical protein
MPKDRYTDYEGGYSPTRTGNSGATITGRVEPDPRPLPGNVTIIKGHRRASEVSRQRYISHLNTLHAQGHMSEPEWHARTDAAQHAEVEADLGMLLGDLPPLPMPEEQKEAKASAKAAKKAAKASLPGRWKRWPILRVAVYIATMATGWTIAFGPMSYILNLKHNVPWGPVVITPTLLGGWAIAIFGIVLILHDFGADW